MKSEPMEYKEYLTDKNVVLVGPSPSICGTKLGYLIDIFDVIVRMNKAVPPAVTMYNDVGIYTDVLYNCLEPSPNSGGHIDVNMWKKEGVKWVCSPYPSLNFTATHIRNFLNKNKQNANLPFHMVDAALYNKVANLTGTRPNTGLLAICDILEAPIKSLTITGMTFGKDGYYKEYSTMSLESYKKMANGANHNQFPQFLYFCRLVKEDKRLCLDRVLWNMVAKEEPGVLQEAKRTFTDYE